MFVDEDDGPPIAFRKSGIDPLHFAVGVLLQRLICRQLSARGRGDLQQDDPPPMPRVLVQQRLQRLETLDDPLGEIPALDAQADGHVGADTVPLPHRRPARGDIGQTPQPARGPLDRDRIRCNPAHVPLKGDGHVFVIDLAFHEAIDGVQEILTMMPGMKPQDVGRQHVHQYLALPRTHAEGLGVGPGDVPEQHNRRLRYLPANELRQEREMEVLDQNHRTVGVGFRRHHVGKLLIHLRVGVPVAGAKRGPDVGKVAQSPQALVAKSVVITLLLLRSQPHPAQGIRRIIGRHLDLIVSIHRFAIRGAGAVRHPDARTGTHDGFQRRHHAARGHLHDGILVRVEIMDVRFPIRDDDDLRRVQVIAYHLTQRLRCPVLVEIDLQPLRFLRLGQHLAHLRQYRHGLARRLGIVGKPLATDVADQYLHPAAQLQPGHEHDQQRQQQHRYADEYQHEITCRSLPAVHEGKIVQHQDAKRRRLRRIEVEARHLHRP